MYRVLAIGIVLFWITAMTALFKEDVLPAWTAQDPPPMTPDKLPEGERLQEQFGIYRIGNGTAVLEGAIDHRAILDGRRRSAVKRELGIADDEPAPDNDELKSTTDGDDDASASEPDQAAPAERIRRARASAAAGSK